MYPQGNEPTVAIQCKKLCMWLLLQAEIAPKMGRWAAWVGSAGGSHIPLPPGAGRWCWPSPACTQTNTARATASQGCQGVENTHELGHVPWTEHILLPTACTWFKSHFLWCSFSISKSSVWWVSDREVWWGPLAPVYIWWGLLPFSASSWALFLSFLTFFLFFVLLQRELYLQTVSTPGTASVFSFPKITTVYVGMLEKEAGVSPRHMTLGNEEWLIVIYDLSPK